MRLRGGAAPLPAGSVCVIGSGNWGSAIARVIALNAETSAGFESRVRMWVYEEVIDGRNLTDVINTDHENPKYLPGIALPANVVAVADLASAVKDASILVWVLPHQFLGRLLPTVKGALPFLASVRPSLPSLISSFARPCSWALISNFVFMRSRHAARRNLSVASQGHGSGRKWGAVLDFVGHRSRAGCFR